MASANEPNALYLMRMVLLNALSPSGNFDFLIQSDFFQNKFVMFLMYDCTGKSLRGLY